MAATEAEAVPEKEIEVEIEVEAETLEERSAREAREAAAISAAIAAASAGVIVRAATAPIDAYWRGERRKSRRRVAEVFCRNELAALRYYVRVAREGHRQLSEVLPPPLPVPPLVLSVPSTTVGGKSKKGRK